MTCNLQFPPVFCPNNTVPLFHCFNECFLYVTSKCQSQKSAWNNVLVRFQVCCWPFKVGEISHQNPVFWLFLNYLYFPPAFVGCENWLGLSSPAPCRLGFHSPAGPLHLYFHRWLVSWEHFNFHPHLPRWVPSLHE